MIPKIIHYCWFGGNPLPELALKCIASWKKYFPDYEIKEWNQSNYDVHKISYISEAYNAKKYAFVSDYARFDILYQYGGIYFDVDVEVIKPFGDIMNNIGFMGAEKSFFGLKVDVAAGLGVGCNADLEVVLEILKSYANEHFLCNDGIHEYNLKTIVNRVTEIFVKKGFDTKSNKTQKVADITIYPPEYFAPKNFRTGVTKITENTYSIHHYDGSWLSERDIKRMEKSYKIYKILGVNVFSRLLISFMYMINHLLEDGLINTVKIYAKIILGKK